MTSATLAILAGGESRRMGRPKAELRVGERPILEYLLERLDWAGPTLLVTAPGRARPPGAERFDREVSDPVPGQGPLRGIVTALEAATTQIVVVASCDMPAVEPRQLHWLVESLGAHPASPFVMLTRHGFRLEPLPFAVRTTALPHFRDHLSAGQRSLHDLARMDGARVTPAPQDWPDAVWTNLNAPRDVAEFLEDLSGDSPPAS